MKRAPSRTWGAVFLSTTLLGLSACDTGPEVRRHSVLLVTFDTTRADVLAPWGGPGGLTPNLDRLAAEGLVFADASTVAPLTLPSHASMLTGLYPPHHGLRENGIAALPASAQTLAEIAQGAGFQTAAFVSALVLDPSFGLDQGFDTYAAPPRRVGSQSSHTPELTADQTISSALAWLDQRDRARPFFLWVHLFDPHGPYTPPPAFRPRDKADAPALYLGEIRFADRELGRLIAALERDGSLEDTFVAFTADHGEAFGEHGEPTHGAYVWETTLHVPLILRDPAGRRAGQRTDSVAGVTDLFPTLLEAMGLPQRRTVDGISLMPLLDGEELPKERGVYFESYSGYISYGWSPLAGWRDAAGKYIHSSRPQFFEPRSDPRESRDLLAADGDLGARLVPYTTALARIGERGALIDAGDGEPGQATDTDLFGAIRNLGYAGVSATVQDLPRPLEPSDRPAPQDNADIYRESLRAQELSNRGEYAQAEAILSDLWRRQPNNPFVLDRLSTVLIHLGEHARAVPLLERLLEIGPGWAGSFCNLGLAYNAVGRVDEAVGMFRRAIQMDGTQDFFWDTLAALLEENGRTEELAQLEVERAARVQPPHSAQD